MTTSRRTRTVRHDSASAEWEVAFARPAEELRRYVREYVGWREQRAAPPIIRRQTPSGDVPVIINFGQVVRERVRGARHWTELSTFVAGIHDAYALVQADGPGHGLQVNFTAVGASLFLNRPLNEFHNRAWALSEVIGAAADRFVEELYDAPTWDLRFDVLDREIGARIASALPLSSQLAFAWEQLANTGGRAPIAQLLKQAGWSERHFIARFRLQFGISPKVMARVLRFHRAVRVLSTGRPVRLTDLAQHCGYYDQSHFIRDFREFAGVTPGELGANRLLDTGFSAE